MTHRDGSLLDNELVKLFKRALRRFVGAFAAEKPELLPDHTKNRATAYEAVC